MWEGSRSGSIKITNVGRCSKQSSPGIQIVGIMDQDSIEFATQGLVAAIYKKIITSQGESSITIDEERFQQDQKKLQAG